MDLDAVRSTVFAAARFTTFTTSALIFGLVPVLYLVLRPSFATLSYKQWAGGRARMAERLDLLVRIALWALIAAIAVTVVLQATVLGELDQSGLSLASVAAVFDSSFGLWLLIRGVVAIALAVVLVGRVDPSVLYEPDPVPTQRSWWLAWFLLGLGLLFTISMSGHAGASSDVVVRVSVDLLHLAAVSIWFAGIVVLAAVLPLAWGRKRDTVQARLLTPVVARFSNVALVAVMAAALTGILATVFTLDAPAELTVSDYGQALFTKVWIFAWILALGAFNHFFLRRKLEAAFAARRPSTASETLRTTVAAELLFAVVIFGATAVLTGLAPPT